MSSIERVKRRFQYGQHGDSWCTKCSGLRCEEDVGFIRDERGKVQGYIIDSEKLGEAVSLLCRGDNGRLRDSSPGDGIYKRSIDVEKLVSRDPSHVNTVRFSDDILRFLLVGTEGCDGFLKGDRTLPLKEPAEGKARINLNRAAADVLSGKRRAAEVKLVRGSGDVYHRRLCTNPLTRGY